MAGTTSERRFNRNIGVVVRLALAPLFVVVALWSLRLLPLRTLVTGAILLVIGVSVTVVVAKAFVVSMPIHLETYYWRVCFC